MTKVAPPEPRRSRLRVWPLLAAWMLASAPMLFLELGRPEVIEPGEARALATSIATWRIDAQARVDEPWWQPPPVTDLVPRYNGQSDYTAAPGLPLLHRLAFVGLDPTDAEMDVDALTWRARLVSAVAVLLLIGAVLWAGYSIGGLVTATLAAATAAALPILILLGRSAAPDAPVAALHTLVMAAALWAMRPLRPAASVPRQVVGWALCGLAVTLALLIAGPLAIPTLTLPLVAVILVLPRRLSHLLGLLAALTIAALLLLPWIGFVHSHEPTAWQRWWWQLIPTPLLNPQWLAIEVGWRAVLAAVLVLPWTPWLLAALSQPFSTSSSGVRRRMFVGWTWFLTAALLLVLAPSQGLVGAVLVVLPAAALLIGQLFAQFVNLSAEGRHVRAWRLLRWPSLVTLTAASVLVPLTLGAGEWFIERQWWTPRLRLTAPMPWYYWGGLAAALLALAVLSFRWALEHYPGRTLAAWSLWMMAAATVIVIPLARGPLARQPLRMAAAQMNEQTHGHAIYWLAPSTLPQRLEDGEADVANRALGAPVLSVWLSSGDEEYPHFPPALILYAGREIPRLGARDVDEVLAKDADFFVLVDAATRPPTVGGVEPAALGELPAAGLRLWRYTKPAHDAPAISP